MNPGGFQIEYYSPDMISVAGGKCLLNARPDSQFAAQGYSWRSACIRTVNQAALPASGGVVQIRAKQPDCSHGFWPGMPWHLNGSAEIDTQEGGNLLGGVNPNNVLAANSHVLNTLQHLADANGDLSAGLHDYRLTYKPGQSLVWEIDERSYYSLSGALVPTGAYEVIINLQMCGPSGSSWHTVVGPQSAPGAIELTAVEIWQ